MEGKDHCLSHPLTSTQEPALLRLPVYMHSCDCSCAHTPVLTCVPTHSVCIHTPLFMCVPTHPSAYMCTYTPVLTCVHTYPALMCMHTHTHTPLSAYPHPRIYMYTHTHTHTHTHSPVLLPTPPELTFIHRLC